MTNPSNSRRTDSASRVIKALPQTVYQAFVNPEAWVKWLPPKDMQGRIHAFEPRKGGACQMSLTYTGSDHPVPGKTSEHTDVVRGIFLELVPDKRIVQQFEFESDDPAFSGAMTMTWTLTAVAEGTEVAIVCRNVPEGIRQEDHELGMQSSLENLAAYTE